MSLRFVPQDLILAEKLLSELFDAVSSEEATLSGGTKLGAGGDAIRNLLETKVLFGNPLDKLIRLTPILFEEVGVELTGIFKRQMRQQFNFYYLTIAVSMLPRRGVQFTRIECSLDFGPKGANEPIVQTIFPNSEWKPLLSWGTGMSLALDGNLNWNAGLSTLDIDILEGLPTEIQARVTNADQLKAFITIPEYSYSLGRTEIAAIGEGNSECFWRIEKPELRKVQSVEFGVVFKVPKDVASIELTGLVTAEPSINWLITNLRIVFEDLSEKLQRLLRFKDSERNGKERLPIGDHEKWTIALPA